MSSLNENQSYVFSIPSEKSDYIYNTSIIKRVATKALKKKLNDWKQGSYGSTFITVKGDSAFFDALQDLHDMGLTLTDKRDIGFIRYTLIPHGGIRKPPI